MFLQNLFLPDRSTFTWNLEILLFVALCSILLFSCRSSRQSVSDLSEKASLDSCRHSTLRYDSIHIDHDRRTELHPAVEATHGNPPLYSRTDTLVITDHWKEFRFQLLRDTLVSHHTDTVTKLQTVEVFRDVRHIPPWLRFLPLFGSLLLFFVFIRLRR